MVFGEQFAHCRRVALASRVDPVLRLPVFGHEGTQTNRLYAGLSSCCIPTLSLWYQASYPWGPLPESTLCSARLLCTIEQCETGAYESSPRVPQWTPVRQIETANPMSALTR